MTDAHKKLHEPAALAAAAYAALSILASVIELLFTSGGSFSDTAAGQLGNLLSFPVALAVAIAVYLANHVDPVLPKARLITMVALGTIALAAVFGVVAFFASFGADVSGTDKFAFFLAGAGGAAAIGASGWYTWLAWQAHAPARPAAPQAPAAGPGPANWGGPQQPGVPPQPQQPGAAPQGQQPAGFSWSPGNANEQTAYIAPQAQPAAPQTLQAQQSPTGSYSVPGSLRPQPGQQQPGQPGQPQAPQQPGDARTQMMPPVPPTMQEYAPNPQPWQPGPGGAAPQQNVPPQHQQQPTQPAEPENGGQGPFGVGNWQ
jgi:hypothetical protein